jgi:GGDEF domain-containing protein
MDLRRRLLFDYRLYGRQGITAEKREPHFVITVSIGIATYPEHAADHLTLVKRAHALM